MPDESATELGPFPLVTSRFALLPVNAINRIYASADPLSTAETMFRSDVSIRNAIRLSTPSLYHALTRAGASPITARRAHERLLMFIIRMASRPTPFGAFAGVSAVAISETMTLAIDLLATKTYVKPDLGMLRALCKRECESSHPAAILVMTNPVMARRGTRLYFERLSDWWRPAASSSGYRRGSLRTTVLVDAILEAAKPSVRFDDLVVTVANATHSKPDTVERVATDLLRAGALVPRFIGNPIEDPVQEALDFLGNYEPRILSLSTFRPLVDDIADKFASSGPASQSPELHDGRAHYHATSIVKLRGGIPLALLNEIARYGAILAQLSPPNLELEQYRRLFVHRYEGHQRVIPLLSFVGLWDDPEQLDESKTPSTRSQTGIERGRLLQHVSTETIRKHASIYTLTDDEFAVLSTDDADARAPRTFEVAVRLLKAKPSLESEGAVNQFVIAPARFSGLPMAGASSARFMPFSAELLEATRAFDGADAQAKTEVEIVYTPPFAWHGNVTARAPRTNRTIELHVGSLSDRALDLSKLFVVGTPDSLLLWSSELGSFITPIDSCAYGTEAFGPATAKFLRALGLHKRRAPSMLAWPENLAFRPRLIYGRFILSFATWRIDFKTTDLAEDKWQVVQRHRQTLQLPRLVVLVDNDNQLPLDLDTDIAKSIFASIVKSRVSVILQEWPNEEEVLIESEAGQHCMELVVSMKSTINIEHATTSDPDLATMPSFTPGTSWTYLRWFCSPVDADRVAVKVRQLKQTLSEKHDIRSWHYLRYRSPRFHMRLRFKSTNGIDVLRDAITFSSELVSKEEITDFELATYEPEYMRYGQDEYAMHRAFERSSEDATRYFSESKDDRLVAAVTSLIAEFGGNQPDIAKAWIRDINVARQPMTAIERQHSRQVVGATTYQGDREVALPLAIAMPDLAHMHFNRFGLAGETERSAERVLWHALKSFAERHVEREKETV